MCEVEGSLRFHLCAAAETESTVFTCLFIHFFFHLDLVTFLHLGHLQ